MPKMRGIYRHDREYRDGGGKAMNERKKKDATSPVQMKRCRWCNQHKSDHVAGRYSKWCREGTGTSYHPFTPEEVQGKRYELKTVGCLRGWYQAQEQ
jgi:hypothetical protein